jgi:hypothetical protein
MEKFVVPKRDFASPRTASLLLVLLQFVLVYGVVAQSADPLAELEAWNKIKESSVAADYHAFLKKFPNGSLAAQARARMNTIGDPVWNELKNSKDPFKFRDYIKANPDSPFLDQAKARFEVLAPALIEWEKLKAAGDGTAVMQFIQNNPSHPFVEEAKADIENSLWTEIGRTGEEDLLEFYALHYSDTERGKEAASKLQTRKATKRERDLQGIRTRIAALNGVRVTYHSPGYPPTEYWFENNVVDPCTFETREYTRSTYKGSLDYVVKIFRIDLGKVAQVYPETPTSWGYRIGLMGELGGYSTPREKRFSGTSQFFQRKSATAVPVSDGRVDVLSESYVVVLSTYDSNIATRFAADLNALVAICKASK